MKLSTVHVFVRRRPAAEAIYADAPGLAPRHGASPCGGCLFDPDGNRLQLARAPR
jgi:hypothetical protein